MVRLFTCSFGNKRFVNAVITNGGSNPRPSWRPFYTQSLIGKCPVFVVKIDPPKLPPDCFTTDIVFFFSQKFKGMCESLNISIEFFPIELFIGEQKYTQDSYFLANIRDIVDVIDRENSDCVVKNVKNHITGEVHENWILGVNTLAIDESKAEGHHLFKAACTSEVLFCASQEFQDLVAENEITGIDFVDTDQWNIF